jgi:hypothetical protein
VNRETGKGKWRREARVALLWPAGREWRGAERWARGYGAPGLNPYQTGQRNQTILNLNFSTRSNFDRSKKVLSVVKKIKIKYGFDIFEERNNFLHRNFKFKVDFE